MCNCCGQNPGWVLARPRPCGSEFGLNYDRGVDYQSVLRELFLRMPDLERLYKDQFSYLGDDELPYAVFGSFLIPALQSALESQDAERVRSICAYLEDVATSTDAGLEVLLRLEVGEWLNGTLWEAELRPYLGEQTKRICRYIPGLGTQRNLLRAERARRNPLMRLLDHFRR
jgi:hypothetical protein